MFKDGFGSMRLVGNILKASDKEKHRQFASKATRRGGLSFSFREHFLAVQVPGPPPCLGVQGLGARLWNRGLQQILVSATSCSSRGKTSMNWTAKR